MLSAGVKVSGSPLCGQNKDTLHPLAVPAPQADLGLQAVLICGWQDTPFMLELLTDLDRGVDKLPRGSEVVLLNAHDTEEISKHVKRLGRWSSLAVRHIKGNPLNCEDLKKVCGRLWACLSTCLWSGICLSYDGTGG